MTKGNNNRAGKRSRGSTILLPACGFFVSPALSMPHTIPMRSASSAFLPIGTSHIRRRRTPIYPSTTFTSLYSSSSPHSNNDKLSSLQQRTATLRSNSKLSLAPMMEYTDRHFRHLIRLISRRTLLYSEMVAANAIAHEREDALVNGEGDYRFLLRYLGQGRSEEGPSVLQLGGSDPQQLFLAAKTVYELNQLHNQQTTQQSAPSSHGSPPIYCNYTALNLNCGCPSPKVAGKGCFGAALMSDAPLVKSLAPSMYEGCMKSMPITIKCRIGTDDGYSFSKSSYLQRNEEEEYSFLKNFVLTVADGGIVTDFQIHARIAVLGKSYSPADNRKVPPLKYHYVKRLAEELPELNISLNGGVDTLLSVERELSECEFLDGIMVGRGFAANPWGFAMADEVLYGNDGASDASNTIKNRMDVLTAYGHHADYEESIWDPLKIRRFLTKAISPLFAGETNAKRFRIALDEIAGYPKQIMKQHGNKEMSTWQVMEGQPPLSELIMEAATKHLSEEVLYRSPRESYEKMIWEEEQMESKRLVHGSVFVGNNTKSVIKEWQESRKEEVEVEEMKENSA